MQVLLIIEKDNVASVHAESGSHTRYVITSLPVYVETGVYTYEPVELIDKVPCAGGTTMLNINAAPSGSPSLEATVPVAP